MKTVLVTPSWARDFEQCRMLVESAKKFATGFDKHLILVDASDEKLFAPLVSHNVELVIKQDLLPAWLKQSSLNPNWWWSLKTLPSRGWIVQQVAKFAIASQLEAEAFCYMDSDSMFVRPYDADQLWEGDKVRLYRDDRKPQFYQSRRYINWYRFAARQFDLGHQENLRGAFIAQMNVIHKQHLQTMFAQIESRWQRPWYETLLANMDFSEFILYGAHVENCTDLANHYVTPKSLCHSSWFYNLESKKSIRTFLNAIKPHQVAIHIQSNLRIDTHRIQSLMKESYL